MQFATALQEAKSGSVFSLAEARYGSRSGIAAPGFPKRFAERLFGDLVGSIQAVQTREPVLGSRLPPRSRTYTMGICCSKTMSRGCSPRSSCPFAGRRPTSSAFDDDLR